MAYSGAWRATNVTPLAYDGATRWGTGVNPVHALRDPLHKPGTTKEPLGSTGPSGEVPHDIIGPSQWGYSVEDQMLYGGEDYRYLAVDHPNWGEDENLANRPDRDGQIMEVGVEPQPEGWPSWGPHHDDNPVDGFPVGGPPGGAAVRAESDGSEVENSRAIAVPTPGYTGGWVNKQRGEIATTTESSPAQYVITTSDVQGQGVRSLDNSRAATRVTDDPRSAIKSRTAGMRERVFAKSFQMGGGPGTPDMYPRQQDLPYRPFFYRQGAMPPLEQHTWSEVMYNTPVQRTLPEDAGEYVTTSETAPAGNYGYSEGDYFA